MLFTTRIFFVLFNLKPNTPIHRTNIEQFRYKLSYTSCIAFDSIKNKKCINVSIFFFRVSLGKENLTESIRHKGSKVNLHFLWMQRENWAANFIKSSEEILTFNSNEI